MTTTDHPDDTGPKPILSLASGFMAAKHLFAASELGLFEALADAPATLDSLAARTGLTPPGSSDQRRRHGGAGPT